MNLHPFARLPFWLAMHVAGILGAAFHPLVAFVAGYLLAQVAPVTAPAPLTQITNFWSWLFATVLALIPVYVKLEGDKRRERKEEADRQERQLNLTGKIEALTLATEQKEREARLEAERKEREVRQKDDEQEAARQKLADENDTLKSQVAESEKRIAELEKVAVQVSVNEAKGAAQKGRLDAVVEKLQETPIIPKAPAAPGRNPHPTLVLAEDDPKAIEKLAKELQGAGYTVKEAVTLQAALDLVAKNPHLAVIDLKLAGEDGFEIIHKIREEQRQTQVVVYTGMDDWTTLEEAKRLVGSDRVVQKPHFERLFPILEEAMKRERGPAP